MQGQDYQISLDFLSGLFSETAQQVELRACPNIKGEPGAATIFTRDPAEMTAFCRRKDVDGIGVYFGVCTRRDGVKSGNLETVVECPALWADIDCLKQEIAGEDAIRALEFLPFPPTHIVNSGGGLHAYWQLEEPAPVTTPQDRDAVHLALKALARIVAGDRAVCESARIMRLPGTRNSKEATIAFYGEAAPCHVVSQTGRLYDFAELVEWLRDQRVVLHGKPEAARPVREDDPFVAYAREAGFEPGIDIDEALAAMAYGASGANSIHHTQLRVSASMIARDYDDDEIVERILAATEKAAPGDRQWNWAAEEKAIRDMIATGRRKGYDRKRERERPASQPMANGNAALAVVHDIEEERAKREKPEDEKRQTHIVAVGQAVIKVWNDRYGPILHTAGTTYCYEGGIWHVWTDAHAQRLRTMIQQACQSLSLNPTTSLLNAAKVYVMDRPSLFRDDVEFDAHGLLIADDAALDLTTMEIVAHSPDHFALFKVAAKLNGSRDCIAWKQFLSGAFADQPDGQGIISTLQEWFGAGIAVTRSRPMLKGLLAHGPSRTGKTQISEVKRAVLGEKHVCNARMSDLEGRFGKEPLVGKRGWIADDAIGAKEYLDAETYKVVVTGEKTSAQIKGGKNLEVRFGFPVMLTANNLPRVNDKSDATYNRSLILPMTVVRPENAPEPPGYDSIAKKVIAEELTGVLWWAIEGRKRLFARGCFSPPSVMVNAGRGFQDSNDPVGSWIRQCLEPCRQTKIARKDLAASFNGWWEMESDDGKPFSANSITRGLKEKYPNLVELKTHGERMFGGVRLNDEGLFAWESRVKSSGFERKVAYSASKEEVNRFWEEREESAPISGGNGGKTVF